MQPSLPMSPAIYAVTCSMHCQLHSAVTVCTCHAVARRVRNCWLKNCHFVGNFKLDFPSLLCSLFKYYNSCELADIHLQIHFLNWPNMLPSFYTWNIYIPTNTHFHWRRPFWRYPRSQFGRYANYMPFCQLTWSELHYWSNLFDLEKSSGIPVYF